MGKARKLALAAAALGMVGVAAAAPAQAANQLTWSAGTVAGCAVSFNASTIENVYMAIGAQAGSDAQPCSTFNSEVRVVADLYLLPLQPGKSTVKMMTAVGHCNQSTDCRRTQGFAQGVMPPGIYKIIGRATVDNYGSAPAVTTTFETPAFTYTITGLQ